MSSARYALRRSIGRGFTVCLVTTLAVTMLAGCAMALGRDVVRGSGQAKTEEREVEKFDRVSVRGSGDVKVTIGETQRVIVTADDNILPVIKTTVKDGELIINPEESINPRTKLHIEITVARLRGASIAGSGNVDAQGISEDEVKFAISGSGDMRVTGTAKKLTGSIAGSGSLHLSDLAAADATIRISGSGDVAVNASDNLDVSIAGSGDVRYVGEPKNVERKVSGSGSVKRAS